MKHVPQQVFDYFNLNRGDTFAIRPFALEKRKSSPKKIDTVSREKIDTVSRKMKVTEQATMYAGTVVGVLLSSAVKGSGSASFQISKITPSTVIAALVIALIVIPIEYRQLQINSDAPFIVRLGLFVQNGVFWQVLIKTIHT